MGITTELLHLPPGYQILSVTFDNTQARVFIASRADSAQCPLCQTASSSLHSHYTRTLADMPCGGQRVILLVQTHKWRCPAPSCPRRIFTERLDPLARVSARMTTRLIQAVQAMGCATSGEGGARLANRLGIATSPSTVLNRLMELPDPASSPPEEIGLDEWSFRRRKWFGTIIVDLQHHQIIDLLPDRESATVARWLKAHPTIRLVSRDRSKEFAEAIREGAPQAIQVLDRFHLLRNLVDLLPSMLARCLAELRRAAKSEEAPPPSEETPPAPLPPLPDGPWKPPLSPQAEARRLARQAERNARYAEVCALWDAGWTDEAIGKRMGLSPHTVQRWRRSFRTDTHRRKRQAEFDRYAAYVRRRWEEGCYNGLTIWRELKTQGYTHGMRNEFAEELTLTSVGESGRPSGTSWLSRGRVAPCLRTAEGLYLSEWPFLLSPLSPP